MSTLKSTLKTLRALLKALLLLYLLHRSLLYAYLAKLVLTTTNTAPITASSEIIVDVMPEEEGRMGSIRPEIITREVKRVVEVTREGLTEEQMERIDLLLELERRDEDDGDDNDGGTLEELEEGLRRMVSLVREREKEYEDRIRRLEDGKKKLRAEVKRLGERQKDHRVEEEEEEEDRGLASEYKKDIVKLVHDVHARRAVRTTNDDNEEHEETVHESTQKLIREVFQHANEWMERNLDDDTSDAARRPEGGRSRAEKRKDRLEQYWNFVATSLEETVTSLVAEQKEEEDRERTEEDGLFPPHGEAGKKKVMEHQEKKKFVTREELKEATDSILDQISKEMDYSSFLTESDDDDEEEEEEEHELVRDMREQIEQKAKAAKINFEKTVVQKAEEKREEIMDELYEMEELMERQKMEKEKEEYDAEDDDEDEDEEEEETESEEDEDEEEDVNKSCADPKEVEHMVDEGINAIFRKKDLHNVLVELLVEVMSKKKSSDGNKEFDDVEEMYDLVLSSLDPPPGKEEEEEAHNGVLQKKGSSPSPSSWEYSNSVWSEFMDSPPFYEAMDSLDKYVEEVAGYNDIVDQVIDYVSGNNVYDEDGGEGDGSVGKTLTHWATRNFGSVKVPPEIEEMKLKAGILLK